MTNREFALGVAALFLGLNLAGCGSGGGSGGVASAPPPPVSYTKIADMTGNRSFQTAGVQYGIADSLVQFTAPRTNNWGSGSAVTIAYTASTDTYQVTVPGGPSASFGPADLQSSETGQRWSKTGPGGVVNSLNMIAPSVGATPLSYTVTGTFSHFDPALSPKNNGWIAVGGVPTVGSDMPRSGSANYATGVSGGMLGLGRIYDLTGSSSATFAANFAAGTVSTTLKVAGAPFGSGGVVFDAGTFSGNGSIVSGGPGFNGSFNGATGNGAFSGAFFGPQALEMGYAWHLTGSNFSAVGTVTGIKQ